MKAIMKKFITVLCAGALLLSQAVFAAAADPSHVTLTAASGGEHEVVLTVAVKNTSFNVLQFAVDYDETKLTPRSVIDEGEAAQDTDSMTSYLAPVREMGKGWMSYEFGVFDLARGVVEYTLYADPASKGQAGGSDADGYITADADGMNLISLHFTLKDTAVFTADSIELTTTESNNDYVILSVKNPDDPYSPNTEKGLPAAVRDFTALGVSLEETAPPAPPEEPDEPDTGGGDTGGGSTGGGSTGGGGSGGGSTGGGSTGNSGAGNTQAPSVALSDVSGHWAEGYIVRLVQAGVVSGYGDGMFRPDQNLSRGELCILVTRALGLQPVTEAAPFTDLEGVWAAPYISAAQKAGLVNGVGGGRFAPDRPVTRQESFKIIFNALALPAGQTAGYPDMDQVQPWALEAVNGLTAAGLLTGDNAGRLNPTAEITRGEMAALVCRALDAKGV